MNIKKIVLIIKTSVLSLCSLILNCIPVISIFDKKLSKKIKDTIDQIKNI